MFLEDLWLTLASQSPRALRHDWSENWCAKCFPRFGSIISSMNSAFKIYSYRPSLLSYKDNAELKQDSCSCHSPFPCFMWLSSWLIVLFMNRMPCIFVWKWSAGTLPPRPSCLLRSSASRDDRWFSHFAAVKWWRHYNELKALYWSDIIPDHAIAWLSYIYCKDTVIFISNTRTARLFSSRHKNMPAAASVTTCVFL